jgi:hypothetical protein
VLLGAGHLDDSDARVLQRGDRLRGQAAAGRPAEIAHVLVEQAVRDEHHPPGALVSERSPEKGQGRHRIRTSLPAG